jgi:hypothetical protein
VRALLILLLSTGFAVAHSFYSPECCSGFDCKPIDSKRVAYAPGGYMVDGRFFVAQKDARKSIDGEFHACFPQPDNLRCLYAPPNGS